MLFKRQTVFRRSQSSYPGSRTCWGGITDGMRKSERWNLENDIEHVNAQETTEHMEPALTCSMNISLAASDNITDFLDKNFCLSYFVCFQIVAKCSTSTPHSCSLRALTLSQTPSTCACLPLAGHSGETNWAAGVSTDVWARFEPRLVR